ncbi:aquaporin-3 [Eurytemora carolleeae]|uniref:aquaporin-3 n=1 Tax=Eurytemora carolleeae TaxID=1294199 RepID=UPI000C78929B|nr:aquaporin-3 [Eurytemora carolleeae]|eukprot:XP_023330362.1 aquaporin-3-like [Eurytemora affinis]
MRNYKYFPFQKFLSECLGTAVLVLVAKGAAIALASEHGDGASKSLPGCLSGGLGVMMGILVSGKISGGHINPAVSVTMAVGRRLPWAELPAYLLGQILGAGVGAALVIGIYIDTLSFSDTTDELAKVHSSVLASSPGLAQSIIALVLDQFIATYLLLLCILAVVEQGHSPGGLLVGLSATAIGLGFGRNAGAAVNPAVDAVPRLVGWLFSGKTPNTGFWLIPLLAPSFGGIAAFYTYRLVIGLKEDVKVEDVEDKEINEEAKLTAIKSS